MHFIYLFNIIIIIIIIIFGTYFQGCLVEPYGKHGSEPVVEVRRRADLRALASPVAPGGSPRSLGSGERVGREPGAVARPGSPPGPPVPPPPPRPRPRVPVVDFLVVVFESVQFRAGQVQQAAYQEAAQRLYALHERDAC